MLPILLCYFNKKTYRKNNIIFQGYQNEIFLKYSQSSSRCRFVKLIKDANKPWIFLLAQMFDSFYGFIMSFLLILRRGDEFWCVIIPGLKNRANHRINASIKCFRRESRKNTLNKRFLKAKDALKIELHYAKF